MNENNENSQFRDVNDAAQRVWFRMRFSNALFHNLLSIENKHFAISKSIWTIDNAIKKEKDIYLITECWQFWKW